MVTEIEQAKRDNNIIIENLERSKAIAGMQKKIKLQPQQQQQR